MSQKKVSNRLNHHINRNLPFATFSVPLIYYPLALSHFFFYIKLYINLQHCWFLHKFLTKPASNNELKKW